MKPLHPGELVVELGRCRPDCRWADRGSRSARRSPPPRYSATGCRRVAGQAAMGFDGLAAPGEDGDAVPALLAVPDRAIAGLSRSRRRGISRPAPSIPAGRRRRARPPSSQSSSPASRPLTPLTLKVAIRTSNRTRGWSIWFMIFARARDRLAGGHCGREARDTPACASASRFASSHSP